MINVECINCKQDAAAAIASPLVSRPMESAAERTRHQLLAAGAVTDGAVELAPPPPPPSSSSPPPIDHLQCITKGRAKGPVGRRLPRHNRHTAAFLAGDAWDGRQPRSGSVPRIETIGQAQPQPQQPQQQQQQHPLMSSSSHRLDADQFDRDWYLNEEHVNFTLPPISTAAAAAAVGLIDVSRQSAVSQSSAILKMTEPHVHVKSSGSADVRLPATSTPSSSFSSSWKCTFL